MSFQAASTSSVERKPLSLRGPGGSRPRLLLAEDSDPVRIVTAAMLKGMGCDVEAVIHGEHAVQSAAENSFDVIVLDIEMPIMDGITAARSIRQMGGLASTTPLMALSAFLADSVRTGHWRDTFDIALPKPANKNELHDAVKTALVWHQDQTRIQAPLPPVIDLDQLQALQHGIAEAIWRQLTDIACRDIEVCVNQIEHVRNGQQHGAVLVFATKLASLGRTFAAPRMATAAQKVQLACSEAARGEALDLLLGAARDTVQALRA